MKAKRGQVVWFWWSATSVYPVRFIRWQNMRRGCGGPDTNKIQKGAKVSSSWLFSKVIVARIPHGCRRGQYLIHPYTKVYVTKRGALTRRGRTIKP